MRCACAAMRWRFGLQARLEYLHQVGIPGIAADVEVVVAQLPLGGLAKDVSCQRVGQYLSPFRGRFLHRGQAREQSQGRPTIFRRAYKAAGHLETPVE
jgi:hypothetical protein